METGYSIIGMIGIIGITNKDKLSRYLVTQH